MKHSYISDNKEEQYCVYMYGWSRSEDNCSEHIQYISFLDDKHHFVLGWFLGKMTNGWLWTVRL